MYSETDVSALFFRGVPVVLMILFLALNIYKHYTVFILGKKYIGKG